MQLISTSLFQHHAERQQRDVVRDRPDPDGGVDGVGRVALFGGRAVRGRLQDVVQAGEQDAAAAERGPRQLHHKRPVHRVHLQGDLPGMPMYLCGILKCHGEIATL